MKYFKLPDLGEGLQEAEIVKVLVAEGDVVDEDAPLLEVDDREARGVGGFVATVRKGDFLAVVARTEWAAIKAMNAVRTRWGDAEPLPDPATVFDHWRSRPVAKQDVTQKAGDAPHIILFPEIAFDEAAFLARTEECVKKYGYCAVVVSEGVRNRDGKFLADAMAKYWAWYYGGVGTQQVRNLFLMPLPAGRAERRSGRKYQPETSAKIPIGRLIRKIIRQPVPSRSAVTSQPARIGPANSASPSAIDDSEIDDTRSSGPSASAPRAVSPAPPGVAPNSDGSPDSNSRAASFCSAVRATPGNTSTSSGSGSTGCRAAPAAAPR